MIDLLPDKYLSELRRAAQDEISGPIVLRRYNKSWKVFLADRLKRSGESEEKIAEAMAAGAIAGSLTDLETID